MENRRLRIILRITVISVLVLSIIVQGTYSPQRAYAWDNIEVHPAINEAAYDDFVTQWMPADPYLKNASLDGKPAWGESWDLWDGTSKNLYKGPFPRRKTIKGWLSGGGFSADEPEWDMALRHFYDPVRTPHYLTDHIRDIPAELQDLVSVVTWTDLETDAYQWCFGTDNPFSFENGKQYYRSALSGTNPDNPNYGKAWRAVGESMHLISDMTVPAHVRNDSHIPFELKKFKVELYDPLEYLTNISHFKAYRSYPTTSDIKEYRTAYGKDKAPPGRDKDIFLSQLFIEVATWTNRNFFSRDTVPRYDLLHELLNTTGNGEPAYPSPMVKIDPAKTDYYYTTVGGDSKFPLARAGASSFLGLWKTPTLVLDGNVYNAQRRVLIPTAIKASAAVLDAFLPRFEVKIDSVQPDTESKGNYIVTAHIEHISTREWPAALKLFIGNGAHVVVDSVDTTVTTENNLDNKVDLNKIKVRVAAKEGSRIKVYYDLGGYKISSEESSSLSIPSQTLPTGFIQNQPGGKTYNYVAPVTLIAYGGAPKSTGYKWSVASGSTLPPGTTVDPDTGIFHGSGIPNDGMFQGAGILRADTYTFKMEVSDGSKTAIGTFSFKVENIPYSSPGALVPEPVPAVSFQQPLGGTVRLPDARVGSGYGASLKASGNGVFPWTWYLRRGSLPPGMEISKSTGVVWGTPLASGAGKTYTFTITVKDRNGNDAAPVGITEPVTYTIFVPKPQ